MRRIIAITQITLDGVMQAPGGPEEDARDGFPYGGWAMRFGDDMVTRVLNDTVSTGHDLLLGRRTYDLFASYWPHQGDNPVTKGFDRATKYVVTRSGEGLDWKRSEQIGNAMDGVRALRSSDGPELHVWGSHKLLQGLIGANLVDEHRLWIAPVVLGRGRRLFEPGIPAGALTLADTMRSPSGILFNTYRPAGPVAEA